MRQEYNVSATAGSDKGAFYASFGYLKNEGIIQKSGFDRMTGRLKADYQVKPWMKIGGNMSYSHYKINQLANDGDAASSGNALAAATRIAPIYPLYMRDGQGNIMYDSNGIIRYDYGDGQNAGLIRPIFTKTNGISDNYLDTNSAEGNA